MGEIIFLTSAADASFPLGCAIFWMLSITPRASIHGRYMMTGVSEKALLTGKIPQTTLYFGPTLDQGLERWRNINVAERC